MLCQKKSDLANESYYLLENEIKKINSTIERLELEQDINVANTFSYQNYLIDENFDEYVNFNNFINSKKKSKSKKTKIFGHLNMNLPTKLLKNKKNKDSNHKDNLGKRGKIIKTTVITENLNDQNSNSSLEDITYREIDGKIGPQEPIYCFCNYVSYGNMIKCDNPKCKKEWFHFHCVGLRTLPKGKWFCSEKCANEYKKITNKK
jgi:hypothetical protein